MTSPALAPLGAGAVAAAHVVRSSDGMGAVLDAGRGGGLVLQTQHLPQHGTVFAGHSHSDATYQSLVAELQMLPGVTRVGVVRNLMAGDK